MNCNEARHHWTLYLDSEGDPKLHLRLNDHLAHCPACADWFARQERLERAVRARLATTEAMPGLWDRVLERAGVRPRAVRGRKVLLVSAGILAAAAMLLAVFLGLRDREGLSAPHLSDRAAELHDQWLRGEIRPDFASTSDQEVDRYLKAKTPFRVHCPPRTDVHFAVQGAGLCPLKGDTQAAYIVGRVGQAPVSILVLERSSLSDFPHDADQLRGGRRHRCREGGYQMVAGLTADNVVVVIGVASPDTLEKLLDAYGSYHDG
jgi:anti-sigma factor RsiW